MGDFRVTMAVRVAAIVFCSAVGVVYSTGLGRCPLYPQMPNLDITKMAGVWFEVERSFYFAEIAVRCTWLNVTRGDTRNGNLLVAVHTANRWTGIASTSYGVAVPSAEGSSSFRYKINSRMPYAVARLLPGAGRYQVLFTDYTRLALIWSCSSINVAHADQIWLLGREREISADQRANIYTAMLRMQLDPDRLIISKNNNCPQI